MSVDSLLTQTTRGSGTTDSWTARTTIATDDPINIILGGLTDAAVTTDANGSLSAKLRGLVKILNERFPSSLGQKTMANSFGVVLASDQAAIPVNIAASATAAGTSVWSSNDVQAVGAVIKASAGKMNGYSFDNLRSSVLHVAVYDKPTTPTTADVPILRLAIQANSSRERTMVTGISFVNGLSIRAKQGVADSDNTAPSTNDLIGNVVYS